MKKLIIAAAVMVFIMCMILSGCGSTAAKENEVPETEPAAAGPEVDTDNAQTRREYLQGYRSDDSVRQILIISHTEGWNAKASFYEKSDDNDAWRLTFRSEAWIGKNGMGKTREGDALTPYGEFDVTGAFGILKNPGTRLDYIDVKPTTFACDEDCEYYNRIIDIEETGHDCHGEEMYSYSPEYNYGMTTSYNPTNTYPDGSAIFIHCKGEKPFTGGCIALDEKDMETMLKAAENGMKIYLDEYYIVK